MFGLACVIYVAYRFLALALSMDAAILREFSLTSKSIKQLTQSAGPVLGEKLKEFIANRLTPTEGDFSGSSDEELFLNEQVEHLRRQGLTEEELNAFIRQAVGTDIGKPEEP